MSATDREQPSIPSRASGHAPGAIAPTALDTPVSRNEAWLEPLTDALERSQQRLERSEARAREQAETIGRLTVELEALKAARADQAAREMTPAPESDTPASEPRWRRYWSWLLAVIAVLGAVALLTVHR